MENIQLYITYIILAFAFSMTFFRFYEFLFKKKSACNCSGACSLKADLLVNVKKNKSKSFLSFRF